MIFGPINRMILARLCHKLRLASWSGNLTRLRGSIEGPLRKPHSFPLVRPNFASGDEIRVELEMVKRTQTFYTSLVETAIRHSEGRQRV